MADAIRGIISGRCSESPIVNLLDVVFDIICFLPVLHHDKVALAALAIIFLLLSPGCYPKLVGPAGPDGKALAWPEMTILQRKAYMQRVVLPRAAAVFQDWRPDRYADVDCNLCHGPGAWVGKFSMPTAHLPRLSGTVLLGPEFEAYPDTTGLKLNRLVPEISDALGLKSFSIITRKGFGCYSCHLGPTGPIFGN